MTQGTPSDLLSAFNLSDGDTIESPDVRLDAFDLTPTLPEIAPKKSLVRRAAEPVGKGILRVFDILARPTFAIAGAAKELIEGGVSPEIAKEALKGFKGEERETFVDVLTSLGWGETKAVGPGAAAEKVLKSLTGFGLDVLFDPLTYISFGGKTVVGKAAEKIGELAPTVRGQVKQGQKALLTFNPLFGKKKRPGCFIPR